MDGGTASMEKCRETVAATIAAFVRTRVRELRVVPDTGTYFHRACSHVLSSVQAGTAIGCVYIRNTHSRQQKHTVISFENAPWGVLNSETRKIAPRCVLGSRKVQIFNQLKTVISGRKSLRGHAPGHTHTHTI